MEKFSNSQTYGLEAVEYPTDSNNKKIYAVGCQSPDDWQYIHEVLMQDGTLEDNIPKDSIECYDQKDHSSTRAVYLLTDKEAKELLNHPKVLYVHENYESYPQKYKAPPEELKLGAIRNYRYPEPGPKQYRNWNDFNQLPGSPNSSDLNRSGYQLLRMVDKADPWYTGVSAGSSQIFNNRIQYYADGKDVDVIVGDEGCWFGHVEFQSNATGSTGPTNYIGGNKLKTGFSTSSTTGTCDLLDLVLDAPYYLDPQWFEASPGTRLTTRWDGTKVPVEAVARSWWGDSSQRSVGFSTIGTVGVTTNYTRASCLGSNTARPTNGTDHGTDCAANTYGRTQGWAFNCNKWSINAYGDDGSDIEQYFTMMKLFHLYKPVNPLYGTKDPTISSNSWGYRSTSHRTTGHYYYRVGLNTTNQDIGVSYNTSTLPGFMNYVGTTGDGNRMKGEHPDNAYTAAGKEMIDAGVIFVGAAGNSNQKQVSPTHPDFNNFWSTGSGGDGGFTGIGYTNSQIPQTTNFSSLQNTSKRITTGISSGTVTSIANSLLGAASLTTSTSPTTGTNDDGYWELTTPFNIQFAGITTNKIYPGTNTYITFGGGSSAYSSLSFSNPPLAKIMMSSADNSCQRLYYGTEGSSPDRTYRIRYEGSAGVSGTLGSPTMVYESVFYENSPNQIDIHMGQNARYISTATGGISSFFGSTHIEFGITAYNSTNRRGFPQQLGKYIDANTGLVVYPVINIGALDDSYASNGKERKVNYSDMGNEIDCYAPADGTLTAFANAGTYTRADNYPGSSVVSYDRKFSGTSSACPVACGLIACKLQHNRTWTWQNVRTWLQDAVGAANTAQFDTGVESTTANDANWANMNSLEGGSPIVIWDALTGNEPLENPITFSGALKFEGITVK